MWSYLNKYVLTIFFSHYYCISRVNYVKHSEVSISSWIGEVIKTDWLNNRSHGKQHMTNYKDCRGVPISTGRWPGPGQEYFLQVQEGVGRCSSTEWWSFKNVLPIWWEIHVLWNTYTSLIQLPSVIFHCLSQVIQSELLT